MRKFGNAVVKHRVLILVLALLLLDSLGPGDGCHPH